MQCVFDGDPAPSINWKLYGDEVENGSDSGRFLISNIALQIDCSVRVTSTFNIISTKVQDNGLVECEATNTNSEGTQSTAASNTSLTVLCEFQIDHSLSPSVDGRYKTVIGYQFTIKIYTTISATIYLYIALWMDPKSYHCSSLTLH